MEQKPRAFLSKKRYIAAVVIATIAFLFVFAVSYSLSYLEFQRISNLQTGVGYDIFEDKLDYSFFGSSLCNTTSFEKVSQDLRFQGVIIDELERKLGKQDENVLLRKKFYSLIEIEHFEFVKEFNLKCNSKINTILFFYSNNKSKIDQADEAGKILGVVSNKNNNLIIYSFDFDLNSDLVNKIEAKYNITDSDVPVIIINGEIKLNMPSNIKEIEKYLS